MRRSPSALMSLSNIRSAFLAILIACLFVMASPLWAQQAPILVTQAVDNSVRTVLPGNVHPMARAEFDRGEAPLDMPLHRMLLVLKRSDQQETALRHLIEYQQYKKSPSYHQWLTPEEFGARFGPADSDIAAVTNWLAASGFQVTQVSNGRTVIEFNGTAGQVKQAFGTAIHKFVVKGEPHWANVADPSIPTALVPVVAGVNTLHNFLKKAHNVPVGTFSRNMKTGQVTPVNPQFTFPLGCLPTGEDCEAVGPYDFATIYDLLPLWNAATPINGTGQQIAIVGRTNVNPADATDFWNLFGLPIPANKLNIILNGPDPGITSPGEEAEADVDIQWSGAAAPGAIIDFVVSESTETEDGIDLSALKIVDDNVAPVMSESFGECEFFLQTNVNFYGAMWEQAAAQGISVMVSTGDSGSAGCDNPNTEAVAVNGLNVNGLASTPFNVAVGGTDFNQYNQWSTYWNTSNGSGQENAKGYIPETTWNETCTNSVLQFLGGTTNAEANCNNASLQSNFLDIVAGSGGPSAAWVGFKPSWQTGTGVPNDNTRDLPDVSLFASSGFLGSFYIICQSDVTGPCNLNAPYANFRGVGGTSVASPAFAGIMALVNQAQNGAQGNPNFRLYNLVSKQPNAFHDIPSGSTIAVPCPTGSLNCTTNTNGDALGVLSGYSTGTAYDLATGLGSVDAANMVNNWNKATFTPTTTTLTLSVPANTVHGTGIPVTVSVSPSPGSEINTQAEDVSLFVSPGKAGNPSIDWSPLASGTASWTTNLLPGGTYQVVAHYGGDPNLGGSYSTPSASITVKPENSSVYMPGVVVGTNPSTGAPVYATSVVYGTGEVIAYWLRADVENSAPAFCTTEVGGEIACPSGTIAFTDNGHALDASPYKLNSVGYTEDQTIELTGGSHNLVATYSGDASYKTSNTSTTITVTTAPTSINDVQAPPTANVNQQFTVTAAVATTSAGVAPTGTVVFKANGTALAGTVVYSPVAGNVNAGTAAALGASLMTSIATAGTYNITATYSGDGNYAGTTSTNTVQIVVSSPVPDFTIAMTATPSPTLVAHNVQWSGTLTAVNGYNKLVTLTCTAGAPSTCIPSAPLVPTAGGASFTVTVGSSTAATYNFTISGTDGTLTHATPTESLTVSQDFSVPATLVDPPAASPGQKASTTMLISPVGGNTFAGNVAIGACTGLPAGLSCTYSQNQITAGSSATTVTISVQTAGPFTGNAGAAQPRIRAQKQRLWLPLSLPLAGLLLVGITGRRLPPRYKILTLCLALALTGFLVACGGGSSSPPPVVVTVSPGSVNTLYPSLANAPAQTKQFSATVSNTTSQSVTWAVTGGNANGSIDQTGLYTAPATLPNPNSPIAITATSTAATSPGTATVNLQVPTAPFGPGKIVVPVTEGAAMHSPTFNLTVN